MDTTTINAELLTPARQAVDTDITPLKQQWLDKQGAADYAAANRIIGIVAQIRQAQSRS